MTGICGPTGAGKTSVIRLTFRFYDPLGGAVLFNGNDIKQFKQRSVRKLIGTVPQDVCLFNNTIRHNVAYGRLDATDAEVSAAADSASLGSFVRSLPNGWDTMVGERGLKLSGGEKQRLAIARCLLKNPPLIILDESTSALDTQTEREIQDAFETLRDGRTTISVAHRLSSIAHAEQILVMDSGEIVERGTHEELLVRHGGRYAGLWGAQIESRTIAPRPASAAPPDAEVEAADV